jgi:hypothetical protein
VTSSRFWTQLELCTRTSLVCSNLDTRAGINLVLGIFKNFISIRFKADFCPVSGTPGIGTGMSHMYTW